MYRLCSSPYVFGIEYPIIILHKSPLASRAGWQAGDRSDPTNFAQKRFSFNYKFDTLSFSGRQVTEHIRPYCNCFPSLFTYLLSLSEIIFYITHLLTSFFLLDEEVK